MNAVASHHHSLKSLAVIYGISAAALLSLAAVVLIGCCYSRRRLLPPPPNPDGASSDEDSDEIEAGLAGEIVKSYPKIIYRQFKMGNVNSAAAASCSCCSICLGEYSDNDTLLVLPDCCHFFHFSCIDLWFKRHSTSPVCRKLPPLEASDGYNQFAHFNQRQRIRTYI